MRFIGETSSFPTGRLSSFDGIRFLFGGIQRQVVRRSHSAFRPIRDHPRHRDASPQPQTPFRKPVQTRADSSLIPSLIIRYVHQDRPLRSRSLAPRRASAHIHARTHAYIPTRALSHPYLQQPFVRFDMIQATISRRHLRKGTRVCAIRFTLRGYIAFTLE